MLIMAAQLNTHFIFSSSSAVYGKPKTQKVKENHLPRPVLPQGKQKKKAELLCVKASQTYEFPLTILRFFNVYGPGQKPTFLIPSIIQSAKRNKPLIMRHPDFRRDFLYIDDLIELIVKVVKRPPKEAKIYNVGSGKAVPIMKAVEILGKLMKRKIKWKTDGKKSTEVSSIYADTTSIRKFYKWRARTSLEKGLNLTLKAKD